MQINHRGSNSAVICKKGYSKTFRKTYRKDFSDHRFYRTPVNHFSPVLFHIETSHLICCANKMTGFYMKSNRRLKWVKGCFCHYKLCDNIYSKLAIKIMEQSLWMLLWYVEQLFNRCQTPKQCKKYVQSLLPQHQSDIFCCLSC